MAAAVPSLVGAGAVVRDITSGEVLVSTDAERPRTIASTQKILSALAITDVLDAESTMKTTVVAGAPGEVVLVAGGDTLLATLIAFAVGYLVIAWFLRYIAHHRFTGFVVYRVLLGAGVLALVAAGTLPAH